LGDLDDHLPELLAGARTQRETDDLDLVLSSVGTARSRRATISPAAPMT
jgi:hypothetical protein